MKIMVEIKRNAFDDQSFAVVKLWTEKGWTFVCQKPIGECQCRSVSYVQDRVDSNLFQRDCDNLLNIATQIVS